MKHAHMRSAVRLLKRGKGTCCSRGRISEMDVPMVDHSLAQYKCDAASAIKLKLVKNENDVFDKGKAFPPEFTHQFFGDSETIFGYNNLEVQLYYHAGSLLTYIGMTFDGKVDGKKTDGLEPDNVIKMIADKLPEGYSFLTNLDDFISKLLGEASFKPMGELLHSYQRHDIDYKIYKVDMSVPKFREYHSRLQTFLLWFIDAASYIDVDDDKWSYFLVFEKKKIVGNVEYGIVGYMTVYHYYAYPDKIRPRISQMLILPPYQKCGHGACLVREVDNFFIKDPQVLDITVEDPSDNFIRLRDFVDASECSKLKAFSPEKLKKGFSVEMVKEGQEKRKINKRQCRRVYEILRLRATDRSNPKEYKDYRLDVKRRLNLPFQREKSDMAKLSRVLSPEELAATMVVQSEHDQKQQLELLYRDLEQSYLGTIERLAAY